MSQFLRPRSQRHPIEHFPLGEHDSHPRGADIVCLIRTVALPEGRRRLLPPTGLLDVLPVVLAYGGAVPGRSAPRRRAAQASLVSWRICSSMVSHIETAHLLAPALGLGRSLS